MDTETQTLHIEQKWRTLPPRVSGRTMQAPPSQTEEGTRESKFEPATAYEDCGAYPCVYIELEDG